jgi:hypothetical protein
MARKGDVDSPVIDEDDDDDDDDNDDDENDDNDEYSTNLSAVAKESRPLKNTQDAKNDSISVSHSLRKYIDLIGIVMLMIGVTIPLMFGDGSDRPPTLDVVELVRLLC